MNLPSLPGGPRTRNVLKIAGYVLVGVVTFVYALHLTFPYDRLKDKGVEALSSKYDVTVGGVDRGWLPGAFTLKSVQLRSRPTKASEVPKIIFIDRLEVDVGVLALITGKVSIAIDAKMGPGHVTGTIDVSGDRVAVSLASSNLPLSDVPGLSGVIGMPMGGKGNVSLALDLPHGDWRKASARLAINCPSCTIGGDGAFFKPRNPGRNAGFVGEGVAVPLMEITSLKAIWKIAGGKIKTEQFDFVSPHIAVFLDFEATLEKNLKDAKVDNGCLRYRGTDALKQLDEKFYNALELTGGPLGSDDNRHLKLVGTLGTFKAKGTPCGGGADLGGDGTDVTGSGEPRTRSRPNLSNVPDSGKPGGSEDGAAAATGTIDPMPATPPDAAPTPKIDDVRPGDDSAARDAAKEAERNGKGSGEPPPPPEGTPTGSGPNYRNPDGVGTGATQPPAPEVPPPTDGDSVHFDGAGAGSGTPPSADPPLPPPENE